tara:strand:+ start:256 stop:759 length:504 start_codon:yes stop_codon:yes gene_type:complete
MRKIVINLLLILTASIFAQPGKSRGPGGQYTDRMEMMRIWRMTEYLELNEKQAEKLFPSIRNHQSSMQEIMAKEKELYTPLYEKAKNNKNLTKAEVGILLEDLAKLNNERAKLQIDFVKRSGSFLDPFQQVKLLRFEPHMKEQALKKMKEEYMRPMPRGKKNLKRKR